MKTLKLTALLVFVSLSAHGQYFGGKQTNSTMHRTTNFFVILDGGGTSAPVRLINPANALIQLGGIYCAAAATNQVVITNTTSETSMLGNLSGSTTLAAGFWAPGKSIRITVTGSIFTGSTPNLTWCLKAGSTVLATNILATANGLANDQMMVDVVVTCRTNSASGFLFAQGTATCPTAVGGSSVSRRMWMGAEGNAVALDTTAAMAMDLTFTSSATTASLHVKAAFLTVIP